MKQPICWSANKPPQAFKADFRFSQIPFTDMDFRQAI
jgi:hypothetical protein